MKDREAFHLFNRILHAYFVSRPNRFLMRCKRKGRTISAYLPNPGRLQELLLPGRQVYLTREENSENRKTDFTVVAVNRDSHPIMLLAIIEAALAACFFIGSFRIKFIAFLS